jgi:ABC-type multidrug transport system ATPase subunit
LLRLLAGATQPTAGTVRTGATVRAAHLSQELRELPDRLRVLEAVEEVARRVVLGGREMSAAQLAEVFGFAQDALWTPVGELSGGERRRLQLLRLLAGEPNVLLFDEPTNDLDTDTLAALEDLLDGWPGTLVIASHDRYLLERVCDTVYALLGDGRLTHQPGGVDQYLAAVDSGPAPEPAPAPARTVGGASAGRGAADARADRKELARLERQVARLEQREADLHEQLAAHATDFTRVTALDGELREVRAERSRTEDAWLEVADRLGDA